MAVKISTKCLPGKGPPHALTKKRSLVTSQSLLQKWLQATLATFIFKNRGAPPLRGAEAIQHPLLRPLPRETIKHHQAKRSVATPPLQLSKSLFTVISRLPRRPKTAKLAKMQLWPMHGLARSSATHASTSGTKHSALDMTSMWNSRCPSICHMLLAQKFLGFKFPSL